MSYVPDNPLIAQSDHTLLLETQSPRFEAARDALLAFAELVKSPEYIHTWRITHLSLWNAAAAGHSADEVIASLREYARYPIPENLPVTIREVMSRYGRLRLLRDGENLRLVSDEVADILELKALPAMAGLFAPDPKDPCSVKVLARRRGELKQVLTSFGHPVADLAGYEDGDALSMVLSRDMPDGKAWSMRDYQIAAIDAFCHGADGGSGVVVLPCGAGKTMVGIGAMVRLGMRTLIVCSGQMALQQWKREILERTNLLPEQVGEYTAELKQLGPVTLTTYQILTWRPSKLAPPAHLRLFHEANWGLVIYDEVHLLPAPIFRESAILQARRRLGLTATLVREDGLEGDVFALIGPKRYDLPWKHLEQQGWIASARCIEVRVALSPEDRVRSITASATEKYRIASRNARKGAVLEKLLERHAGEQILVLGTYLDQLEFLARRFGVPVITGDTTATERKLLYQRFRDGELRVLALSKVGNFSVDLPGASVAVQISGSFGSRQEEAQRLGRVLRPKAGQNHAWFYTLVTSDSPEQEFADRRQLFLTEQGYPYRIEVTPA
jgi:DNA excision repair protein ERCC-3